MANIQHLYRGEGNPNDNPALVLTGDAVGNHLYQDLTNSELTVWISSFNEQEGRYYHHSWDRVAFDYDLAIQQIESNDPWLQGQMGMGDDGTLFIAMQDPDSGNTLRWRSTGITMGDWYTPLT